MKQYAILRKRGVQIDCAKDFSRFIKRKIFSIFFTFKILFVNEQTEYQISDRISFIWKFRETLTKAGIIKDLFNLFNKQIG